jgi:beta-aspartyl-dipeptidase (metallo-type)
MFTLIENGDVYAPEPLGRVSILLTDGRIAKVGRIDRRAVEALGIDTTVIDAEGCYVVPGLIDPHIHLLGGSGEGGFNQQSPEFFIGEIVRWGITTVVGTLGVDTTMKTMAGLLAKTKAMKADGMNAFLWTGGYSIPPTSIMSTVRDDIMFIEEVIGAGEVAISDVRSMDPSPADLARAAHDCYVGGLLAGKAGLLHLHVGERDTRLKPVQDAVDEFNVDPCWFYPTHVERTKALFDDAIGLAKKGMPVDVDVVEEDLPKWLRRWRDAGAPPERLTVSSDASLTSPRLVYEQLRACVKEHGFALADVLPLATENVAEILKLPHKGRIEAGCMGDVVMLERGTLEVVHVLSRGVAMVRDGDLVRQEKFLEKSNRVIELTGTKGEQE